ncbi:MAG: S8 family serine peptidase [Candidatus Marinimicrobia bacterium]|nr:S8 family serine peptidase [Candidatus Neomarinimicrobiota bacterium]
MFKKIYKKFTICFFLLILVFNSLLSAQLEINKYYFNNKNRLLWVYIKPHNQNQLKPIRYSNTAKKRLKQAGWENNITDFALPLDAVQSVASIVDSVRHCSRSLRAISVSANYQQYRKLLKQNFVKTIAPVAIYKRPTIDLNTKDKRLAKTTQYGYSLTQLKQINIPKLHELGFTGKGVRIALLDAGFNKNHEAFQKIINENRLIAERDFIFGDNNVTNQNQEDSVWHQDSHGTSVWSLIGAYRPGKMIGGAYNAKFILGKTEVIRSETRIEEDNYIAGVEWADSLGVDIISSSLGYRDFDGEFKYAYSDLDGKTVRTTQALNWASKRGILCVTAAGNEKHDFDDGGLVTPGDSPYAITVGAVDSSGQLAGFSSHGPTFDGRIKPDLCAMGVHTMVARSTPTQQNYSFGGGTSYATPLITAGCALLLEHFKSWSPRTLLSELKEHSSLAENPNNLRGWGIPDFFITFKKNQIIPEPPAGTSENTIVCAPNPANNLVTFYFHNPQKVLNNSSILQIYNINGEKIYSQDIQDYLPKWHLEDQYGQKVPTGIYFIRIKSQEGLSKYGKLSVIF